MSHFRAYSGLTLVQTDSTGIIKVFSGFSYILYISVYSPVHIKLISSGEVEFGTKLECMLRDKSPKESELVKLAENASNAKLEIVFCLCRAQ